VCAGVIIAWRTQPSVKDVPESRTTTQKWSRRHTRKLWRTQPSVRDVSESSKNLKVVFLLQAKMTPNTWSRPTLTTKKWSTRKIVKAVPGRRRLLRNGQSRVREIDMNGKRRQEKSRRPTNIACHFESAKAFLLHMIPSITTRILSTKETKCFMLTALETRIVVQSVSLAEVSL